MQKAVSISAVLLTAMLASACQQMPVNPAAEPTARTLPPAPTVPARGAAPAPAPQAARLPAVEFRLGQAEAAPNLVPLKLPGGQLWMLPQPVLTRADLQTVTSVKSKEGRDYVRFAFNPAGAQKLAAVTQRNVGKTLIFSIDGNLVATPTIGGPMNEGTLFVPLANTQQANNVAAAVAGAPATAAK